MVVTRVGYSRATHAPYMAEMGDRVIGVHADEDQAQPRFPPARLHSSSQGSTTCWNAILGMVASARQDTGAADHAHIHFICVTPTHLNATVRQGAITDGRNCLGQSKPRRRLPVSRNG